MNESFIFLTIYILYYNNKYKPLSKISYMKLRNPIREKITTGRKFNLDECVYLSGRRYPYATEKEKRNFLHMLGMKQISKSRFRLIEDFLEGIMCEGAIAKRTIYGPLDRDNPYLCKNCRIEDYCLNNRERWSKRK